MYLRCATMSRFDKNTFLRAGLCLVWIAGLSLGFYAARLYGDALCASVLLAPGQTPTFWGALSVNVLPLLISACAVFFLRTMLFPICFFRALYVGLGLGAMVSVYSSAGWMMSGLLMFGALVFSPVLLWYWCSCLEHGRDSIRQDTFVCLGIGLVIALADLWMVSPFVREVINF